jgi:hypothetical protein
VLLPRCRPACCLRPSLPHRSVQNPGVPSRLTIYDEARLAPTATTPRPFLKKRRGIGGLAPLLAKEGRGGCCKNLARTAHLGRSHGERAAVLALNGDRHSSRAANAGAVKGDTLATNKLQNPYRPAEPEWVKETPEHGPGIRRTGAGVHFALVCASCGRAQFGTGRWRVVKLRRRAGEK